MSTMRYSRVPMALMMYAALSSGCDSSNTTSTQGSGGNGGQSTSSSTTDGGGGTVPTGNGGGGAGAGGMSTGGGGSTPVIPGCIETCNAAADCAGIAPIYGEDNYACTAGKCEYKGCNSTQECIDTFQAPNYVCAPIAGLPYDSCIETCNAAADCAGVAPIYGEDNYACTAGKCEYKGCNSTQECIDTFQAPNYVCAPVAGLPYDSCIETCNVAADCAGVAPVYGEDNYACTAGKCEYKGCNSTQECIDTFQAPNYVCQ